MQDTLWDARDTRLETLSHVRVYLLNLGPHIGQRPFQRPPPARFPSFPCAAGRLHLWPGQPSPRSARLGSSAFRGGLVRAEHAGFGEQSRAWFQHLIQFVLPRLKYEMVASQTFKGQGVPAEI